MPVRRQDGGVNFHSPTVRMCLRLLFVNSQSARRKRSAFKMTETELRLMAAAASIGLSKIPNVG